jgi:hypothetical protein
VELKGKQLNTVLAQNEYKKRHDIFAKIIHMNLAVKFNLLKNTQPHYSYTPESCLENDNYKLNSVQVAKTHLSFATAFFSYF